MPVPSRILVIDDDEEILEVTKMILEQEGYDVDTGRSAADLNQALDQQRPNLIIMDIWLNQEDGNSLTHMLKTNPETQEIPIILFSALTKTDDITQEADGFLRKPYDMDTLLSLVTHHLHTGPYTHEALKS